MAAALGSATLVAPVLVGLLHDVRRVSRALRAAYLFLVAGGALVVADTVGAAIMVLRPSGALPPAGRVGDAALAAGEHPRLPPAIAVPAGTRLVAAAALAVCGAAAAVLLLAGLLRLPGIAPTGPVRLRHTLDGVAVAVSAFLLLWLGSHLAAGVAGRGGTVPDAGPGPDLGGLVVGASGLTLVAVVGISAVTAYRATVARPAVLACAIGLGAVAAQSHGLAAAVRAGAGRDVLAWVGVGTAGLVLVLATVWRVGPIRVPGPGRVGSGMALAVVPTMLGLGATVLYAILVAPPDRISVFGAVVLGFGLGARQSLAHREIRAQAVQLAAQGERFRTLALTDPLTSLANRRRLLDALRDCERAGERCALIAIDLDGFKNVNDMRGHDVGDEVLAQVAARLREATRPGDLAARLGGDEFAVVVRDSPDHPAAGRARTVADRLRATLSAPYEVPAGTVTLSASIGLSAATGAGDTASLLHSADVALRAAKQRGKNRVERYAAADERWLRRRVAMRGYLPGAIERGELDLAYQPIVAVPGGPAVGVEALLRWHSPVLGVVPAAEFIPVAEDAALISDLDGWTLHQACRQLAGWLGRGHDVWISVNVSAYSLRRPGYVARVARVLRAHPVPADRIVLEIAAHHPALHGCGTAALLEGLRGLGVRVALDNFGGGRSALRHLSELPVDIVKINPSRMLGPGRVPAAPDTRGAQVMAAVVALGHRLGLEVIAHGICGTGQRAIAEAACVRLVQGDLYARPQPAGQIEALLQGGAGRAGGSIGWRPPVPTARSGESPPEPPRAPEGHRPGPPAGHRGRCPGSGTG